jgi:hypothetical protein
VRKMDQFFEWIGKIQAIREVHEKCWKSDNISGLDASPMYKSMTSIWARSLSEFQSSGVFIFRACFQMPLGGSDLYHRWTNNSTTTCIVGILADLNLFIITRGIFVLPLQELRWKIPLGDLYYPLSGWCTEEKENEGTEAITISTIW